MKKDLIVTMIILFSIFSNDVLASSCKPVERVSLSDILMASKVEQIAYICEKGQSLLAEAADTAFIKDGGANQKSIEEFNELQRIHMRSCSIQNVGKVQKQLDEWLSKKSISKLYRCKY